MTITYMFVFVMPIVTAGGYNNYDNGDNWKENTKNWTKNCSCRYVAICQNIIIKSSGIEGQTRSNQQFSDVSLSRTNNSLM